MRRGLPPRALRTGEGYEAGSRESEETRRSAIPESSYTEQQVKEELSQVVVADDAEGSGQGGEMAGVAGE